MKKIVFILMLFALTLGAGAQKGIFQPVTVSDLVALKGEGGSGSWFLRLNGTVDFVSVTMSFDEAGKFTGFSSDNVVKTGFAASYAHYIVVNDQAVNNYSINAMLLLPVGAEQTYVAPAVSVSAFNFDVGIGYNIRAGAFKTNIFGMLGVHLNFGDLSL
jgi:hypothetical protein